MVQWQLCVVKFENIRSYEQLFIPREVKIMAVPKKKVSRARRDKRRSVVSRLTAPAFSHCNNCNELKVPHRVCGACGFYKGKEVLVTKEA
jgi:large subunit ribosomal protein L32